MNLKNSPPFGGLGVGGRLCCGAGVEADAHTQYGAGVGGGDAGFAVHVCGKGLGFVQRLKANGRAQYDTRVEALAEIMAENKHAKEAGGNG